MRSLPSPTTGDANVDHAVKETFIEAIGLIDAILADRHPEISREARGQTSAIIADQSFPIFASIMLQAPRLWNQMEAAEDAGDTEATKSDAGQKLATSDSSDRSDSQKGARARIARLRKRQ